MKLGKVYEWVPDPSLPAGGSGALTERTLPRLQEGSKGLVGRYVRVINRGMVKTIDPATGVYRLTPMGDVEADGRGDFIFSPEHGGGRMDKREDPTPAFVERYIQAARFGEVNTYFHLDKMASYINELLQELGAPPLPPVAAVVYAHDGVAEKDGMRDGLRRAGYRAFEGGHYRLPRHRYDIPERHPISPDGEIHLGPGRHLTEAGALAALAGKRYRINASHNPGILYHEYGHHLTRHTADFRANGLRRRDRQSNAKSFLDEGTADYWTAALLGTPHVWAWHRKHDETEIHRRSLASSKTMKDFDPDPGADPHANGTIWAAALWELRREIGKGEGSRADRLVLQMLLQIGSLKGRTVRETVSLRSSMHTALEQLLIADQKLYGGKEIPQIMEVFRKRGIEPNSSH